MAADTRLCVPASPQLTGCRAPVAPACGPLPSWTGADRGRLLAGAPRGVQSPSLRACSPCATLGPGLAAFLGCRIDYFDSLFAGDINSAGSRDGCLLTSHPGLDSSGSRCPGPEEMEAGLSGRLRSQWASRNTGWDRPAAPRPPTCLPPNRRGELLKMQFPFIFPVKSLPVP